MISLTDIKKRIKLACLGGALNSAVGSAHMAALRLSDRFELSAGCFSRHQDVNAASGNTYGLTQQQLFSDLEGMIANGVYDAVVILTPTDAHYKQVSLCLNADIPVICEKALASDSRQAGEIVAICESEKKYLSVIYNYTGFPMLRELRSQIKNGNLGHIRHVQIEMPQEGFLRLSQNGEVIKPQTWRLSDCSVPTVSLDLGVHLHAIIGFLTGKKPLKTIGMASSHGHFKEIVDSVSCMIEYTDGMQCNMWFTKAALGNRNGLKVRVFGEKGSAEWLQMEPEFLRISDNRGDVRIVDRASSGIIESNKLRYARFKPGHPSGFIEAFSNYYEDVYDSLKNYIEQKTLIPNEYVFGAAEAAEGLRLFEAVQLSLVHQAWVNVSDI
jgi:predicted dehydrogenase